MARIAGVAMGVKYRQWARIGRFGLLLAFLAAIRCVAGVGSGDESGRKWHQSRVADGQPGTSRAGGLETHELTHQEQRRTYALFAPASLRAGEPVPLVLVFHGGHGRGDRLARRIGMNQIAREERFIVAYPDAAGDRHWNDGRTTTRSSIDDVAFTQALIADISAQWEVDPMRIYATGFSNGGSFTARLACELSESIAAFAQVSSTMSVELRAACAPDRAVPIMIINGTQDPLVPWHGGSLRQSRKLGKGGEVISAADALEFWTTQNACSAESDVRRLEDRDPDDGTSVERTRYGDCRGQAEVQLIAVEGGGHTWPGSPERPRLKRTVGKTSRDINASELIWEFFSSHPLP